MATRYRPTLHEKITLIKQYEESGMSKSAFSKRHNIPKSSFSCILSQKQKLFSSLETYNVAKRKRFRMSNYEDIETALIKWVNDEKAKKVALTGIILREKAIEIAKELGNSEFSASNGWFERFKGRYGLKFRKVSGNTTDIWLQCLALLPSEKTDEQNCDDSSSVIVVSKDEWKNSFLKYVLDKYQPSNIYSFVEMQLLYRFLPDINSQYKDLVTLLFCVNVNGADKLKPLVIGKYSMPKCFKYVAVQSLPVNYKSNSDICISSELWMETIKEMDKKFQNEKKKVAVIVEIAPFTTKVKLKAIELLFMPPNVAAFLKPYKQEIVLNFKNNYRKYLIRDWIDNLDNNCSFKPTILDAVEYTFKSWRNISARTIQNCFRNAGFFGENCVPETDDEVDLEKNVLLSELFQELTKRGVNTLVMDWNSYLDIDDIFDADKNAIFEASSQTKNFDSNNKDETCESDLEEIPEKPPSKKDALKHLDIIQKYLFTIKDTTLKDHKCLYQIEHRISSSENNSASENCSSVL